MKKYLLITTLFLTSACVETVVLGGVTTGVIINQEKSVSDTKNDLIIETKIQEQFALEGLKNPINSIGVTVDEQRVLLTGSVDNEKIISKANEIAWRVSGVKEVIDEIQFNEKKTALNTTLNYVADTAITAEINSKLLFNKKVSSSNLEVITVNKIVYLIGIAKNKSELSIANDIAAKTPGVQKVISHVRVAD